MEDILRAIVLGVVQGLTEFLPISSSGHLILARELFGWEFTDDLTFDVSLHIGTTVAVLSFFWLDWLTMFRSALLWVGGQRERHTDGAYDAHVLMLLVLGSVPIAIAGFLLQDWVEEEVRSPVTVGVMLVAFGVLLFAADRYAHGRRSVHGSSPFDALFVGIAQTISLVPGVSRSGITISAGLARGFSRQDAARFSFLLSTPAIGGAALLTLSDAASEGTLTDELDIILAGAVASAVVGWLSIAYLMRLIQTRSFLPFVVYRLVAGVAAVLYFGL
jgi:undecaprenyl-diphosphatase